MEASVIEIVTKTLFIGIGILLFIQILYHLIIYISIIRHQGRNHKGKNSYSDEQPPLSIIIYHNGEAEELEQHLPSLLTQDYPQYEVIVITDHKIGESVDYLKRIKATYPHLYYSYLPESSKWISRKKLAITLGIRASKYEWLIFTESFCKPQSNRWLALFARNFTPTTQIVLGYSAFQKAKGWRQRCISFDNYFRSLRFLCFALLRLPYMGIGRNMAYRKELFTTNKGFGKHLDLLRGDDDLFINQVANRKNTRVVTDNDASVVMEPVKLKKFWREERLGYESTSRHFKGIHRHLLGFETLTRFLFFLFVIGGIAWGIIQLHIPLIIIASLCLIIRFVSLAFILNKSAKIIGEKNRYYFTLPLLDVLQPLHSLKWKLAYLFSDKSDYKRR